MKIRWEDVDLEKMIQSMRVIDIAEKLGVGATAVRKRMGFLGISNPRSQTGTSIYLDRESDKRAEAALKPA